MNVDRTTGEIMDCEMYQVMPPLSENEYQNLKTQIARDGVLVPVEYDEDGNLLDGFHRIKACRELGKTDWPSITRTGLTEIEKRTHARTINANRRHLNREQKRELVRAQLLDTPEWSNRRVAEVVGVTHPTVLEIRQEMIANNEVVNFTTLTGADGKEYPAEMPTPEPSSQTEMGGLFNRTEVDRKRKESDAKKLQAEAPDLLEQVKTGDKSIPQAKRELTQRKRQESPPLPSDKYRVLYADPPWNYGNAGVIGETDNYGHVPRHYPSMTITELCEMGDAIKNITEKNAVLFLWVTSPLLEECFPVINAWGFKYKTSFVWDKVAHNFGHYNSVRHELLLICTRGSCTPDTKQLIDSVQSVEKTRTHSEKPEEFRAIIDMLYIHGKRLELFARTQAEGWEVWGNEPG